VVAPRISTASGSERDFQNLARLVVAPRISTASGSERDFQNLARLVVAPGIAHALMHTTNDENATTDFTDYHRTICVNLCNLSLFSEESPMCNRTPPRMKIGSFV
jgi:hypothetical protein